MRQCIGEESDTALSHPWLTATIWLSPQSIRLSPYDYVVYLMYPKSIVSSVFYPCYAETHALSIRFKYYPINSPKVMELILPRYFISLYAMAPTPIN
jgi:hypothetical protein